MRALIQRVSRAQVSVEGKVVGQIDKGLLILLGITDQDTQADIDWLVGKVSRLRIFDDEAGQMNRSVQDIDGQALVISQFTLYASTKKGNRPSYMRSARPEQAEPMYDAFVAKLTEMLAKPVPTGRFGAMMAVELVNDGPTTIWIDSQNRE